MKPKIESSWQKLLSAEFDADYFSTLRDFLVAEKKSETIYPPGSLIFCAFDHTPVENVKAVILGQDPYHGPNQAHGLCFSVNDGVVPPPSLKNIFKELKTDIGMDEPVSGNLTKWADQGVLLLNATLTVRSRNAGSHQGKGWEQFTDAAIQKLSNERKSLVFLLWGKFAQNKSSLINTENGHLILNAPHPSPFSAHTGFLGCKHFSKTNDFLKERGIAPIDWNLNTQ
ncbi:MAG: uracil-DNA glycosylase [Flavobacteriales bacterium]|nr:uracil-DNA glycosylase [Flavobacteriales bacterium]